MDDFELVWDTQCDVGESCVWDRKRGLILFADLLTGRLFSYGLRDGSKQMWQLPDLIGSFGLCRSGRLVVALRRRVVYFDLSSGHIDELTLEIDEIETNKFNDGKIGPDGCLWVGTGDMRPADQRGPVCALYRVSPDGHIERKSDGYFFSNGLAWSLDGRTLYHSDSWALFVDAWDFDPSNGNISRRRRFATFGEGHGKPDGAACDTEGNYWSAAIQAGALRCYSPDGELLRTIALPIPTPTMPCFTEDSLFITSMRRGASEATLERCPALGGLFRIPAPALGVEIGLFADD